MKEKAKTSKSEVTRRSVHLPNDVYENVCTLAREKHTTPAEIMRSLITKGLSVGFIEDSEGMIRRIIYEAGKDIADHGIDRLIKLQLKDTKMSSSALFMLLLLVMDNYMGEMSEADLLANAFKQSAKYMRMKEKEHEEYLAEAKEFIAAAKAIGRKDDN